MFRTFRCVKFTMFAVLSLDEPWHLQVSSPMPPNYTLLCLSKYYNSLFVRSILPTEGLDVSMFHGFVFSSVLTKHTATKQMQFPHKP